MLLQQGFLTSGLVGGKDALPRGGDGRGVDAQLFCVARDGHGVVKLCMMRYGLEVGSFIDDPSHPIPTDVPS